MCIKHENSHMSFKKSLICLNIEDIEYVQISFILTIARNSCDPCTNL
jgi:hypothetical protein